MQEVQMPKMGMTMEEGTIVSWLKQPGDPVVQGEPILEITTDKVTLEVEAPETGNMGPHLAMPDDILPVGAVLCYILQEGEEAPAVAPRKDELPAVAPAPSAKPVIPSPVKAVAPKGIRVSPRGRREAEALGIDLSTVVPERGGRIVAADVRRAAEAQTAAAEDIQPLHGIRKIVAERMAHSFQTVPHFYLTVETDAGALLKWREDKLEEVEADAGVRPTITDLLIKIVAAALREHPMLNTSWATNGIRLHEDINIGIAIETGQGLVVPVISQADEKSLVEIARGRHQMVERAKAGKLALSDLEGGTFTLTNLGMFGIDVFDAIVNTPECAILAVGRIKERPLAANGQVIARPTLIMTLSADHRIVDGAGAARFMTRVEELTLDSSSIQA